MHMNSNVYIYIASSSGLLLLISDHYNIRSFVCVNLIFGKLILGHCLLVALIIVCNDLAAFDKGASSIRVVSYHIECISALESNGPILRGNIFWQWRNVWWCGPLWGQPNQLASRCKSNRKK